VGLNSSWKTSSVQPTCPGLGKNNFTFFSQELCKQPRRNQLVLVLQQNCTVPSVSALPWGKQSRQLVWQLGWFDLKWINKYKKKLMKISAKIYLLLCAVAPVQWQHPGFWTWRFGWAPHKEVPPWFPTGSPARSSPSPIPGGFCPLPTATCHQPECLVLSRLDQRPKSTELPANPSRILFGRILLTASCKFNTVSAVAGWIF